ncbi:19521_t:CDS:2 [Funneliformis geosporum]|uniref:7946_t:CDS:1 n=1 Tax=Funneliformis geosporum TaxID=1117311 RepID=A0A9W4SYH5_9GLOM|nr:7946_t:CDS:2 [Funneliformis geosporum]CAI2186216.1 19521_t:CDS:2 [Funneliformis geosporum]
MSTHISHKFTSCKTLQKRRARENETQNERETCLARNREYKQRKREKENAEENEALLVRDREQKRAKLAMETDEQREKRVNDFQE